MAFRFKKKMLYNYTILYYRLKSLNYNEVLSGDSLWSVVIYSQSHTCRNTLGVIFNQ